MSAKTSSTVLLPSTVMAGGKTEAAVMVMCCAPVPTAWNTPSTVRDADWANWIVTPGSTLTVPAAGMVGLELMRNGLLARPQVTVCPGPGMGGLVCERQNGVVRRETATTVWNAEKCMARPWGRVGTAAHLSCVKGP